MFWNLCCCGRKDNNSTMEMENPSNPANSESHNTQISVISGNEETNGTVGGQRIRTQSQSSMNSMYSVKSFYSARSTTSNSRDEADYYSICSVESFKST